MKKLSTDCKTIQFKDVQIESSIGIELKPKMKTKCKVVQKRRNAPRHPATSRNALQRPRADITHHHLPTTRRKTEIKTICADVSDGLAVIECLQTAKAKDKRSTIRYVINVGLISVPLIAEVRNRAQYPISISQHR